MSLKHIGRLAGGSGSGSKKRLPLWRYYWALRSGFRLIIQVMSARNNRQDANMNHVAPVKHPLDSRITAYRIVNQYKPLRLLLMARTRFQGVHFWQKLEPASEKDADDRRRLLKRKYSIGVVLQVFLHLWRWCGVVYSEIACQEVLKQAQNLT